jgi:hypothetical protein
METNMVVNFIELQPMLFTVSYTVIESNLVVSLLNCNHAVYCELQVWSF